MGERVAYVNKREVKARQCDQVFGTELETHFGF